MKAEIRIYTEQEAVHTVGVNLLDPRPTDFTVDIVARSLSRKTRYTGLGSHFYSVAQHCVLLSQEFPDPQRQLHALLHELDEVFLPDIVKPLRAQFPCWEIVAEKHMRVGAVAFGIQLPIDESVKRADAEIQLREMWNLGLIDGPENKSMYFWTDVNSIEKLFKDHINAVMRQVIKQKAREGLGENC